MSFPSLYVDFYHSDRQDWLKLVGMENKRYHLDKKLLRCDNATFQPQSMLGEIDIVDKVVINFDVQITNLDAVSFDIVDLRMETYETWCCRRQSLGHVARHC